MVSIIIPILNEEKNIIQMQKNLKALEGDFEVIFSDGGSTDRTLEMIDPAFRVVKSQPGRGMQMNAAAEAAKGEIFFFTHCDVFLEKNVLLKFPQAVLEGKAVGYFRIVFLSTHWLMKVCGFMSHMRAVFRKIVFADQGFVLHRDLFYKCGMMPDLPIMEDYEFSIRLKERAVPLQKIPGRIVASARRFEQNGMLRTMWQMQKLQHRYRRERKAGNLQEEYGHIR